MKRKNKHLPPAMQSEFERMKAASKARLLTNLAATFERTGVWWTASMDRWHNQTGVAHIVHNHGALCGSKPFSTGGSYSSAESTGARECRRCRHTLNEVIDHANATTD